jgi:hypothetical protein
MAKRAGYTHLRQGKQINPTEMLIELWSSLPRIFMAHVRDSCEALFSKPTSELDSASNSPSALLRFSSGY